MTHALRTDRTRRLVEQLESSHNRWHPDRPAATGCRVTTLIHPELLLEVHATAIID